jgi:hypothetical protein
MKRILTFLIVCILTATTVVAAPVVDITEEKTLIRGVTYKNIKGLYSSGWHDVHIVTADLNEKHLKLEVLKNQKGESYTENTLTVAKSNDTVVAVNADFFAAKRGEAGRGSAVGVEIRDGKLYSSASVAESMGTFYKAFDENGFNIDAFTFDITVTAANGMQDKIKLINKYDDLTGIVMYTDDWAEKSVGSLGGIIEVSVDKNGVVLEKATETEPITIPEGGYVLSAHMSFNTFLLDNVEIGDKISVDITSAPDYKKIETAVGGGAILVRDGAAQTEFSHNVTGRNPRTAIGLDKTGKKVTLVVLEGRSNDARGMTQIELAELMAELGCYTALNLDGGGSSTMVADVMGEQKVLNTLSDGSLRNVTNSVGITTTLDDKAELKHIKLVSPQYAFCGFSTKMSIYGVDEYQRDVNIEKIVIYKTDNGTIKDGVLIPKKAGKATVTAYCMGLTAKTEIAVLDTPAEIYFNQDKVALSSGKSYTPVLMAKDILGRIASIDTSEVKMTSNVPFVEIEDGKIKAISQGAAHINAEISGITANMQVLVDGAAEIGTVENVKTPDPQNIAAELNEGGYRFAVFGNTRNPNTLFDKFIMNRATLKMKQSSDFQYILGADINKDTLTHIDGTYHTAKEYSCITENGDTFIMLPNVGGSIFSGDTSVWTTFLEDVEECGKNLFVFIDRNYISQNETEIKLFKDTVSRAAKSRNVYVFGGGFVNKNTIEENVRYINTAGVFPSVSLEGTSVSYVKYVLVTVNGTDVTYEYKEAVR